MSEGYFGKREKLYLSELHHGLIAAHHILHHHKVLDAYGHISVRNPDDPQKSFWLPQNLAPGLLSSEDELIEISIETGEPVEKDEKRQPVTERFIHSELYKKFPDVNCVVHSHASEVLPYCVGSVPLKSMEHMAAFLGTPRHLSLHLHIPRLTNTAGSSVPVWDYPSSASPRDFIVRDANLGHQFAAEFKPSTSAGFLMGKVRSALPTSLTGSGSETAPEPAKLPDHPVVLMRGHGFSVAALSIEEAVYMAVYTREAAMLQTTSMQNAMAWGFLQGKASVDGKVDVEGGGKIKGGKVAFDGKDGGLKFLSTKEADDSWADMGKIVGRAWKLWCREVESNPMYVNEVKPGDEGEGGGS